MWVTALVVVVFFSATLVRSALGFGEALIAVPVLALVLPIEIAAPVAVLVSVTVAAIVLAQDWRHVNQRSAAWLVCSTLPGIPLGILLLRAFPSPSSKVRWACSRGFAALALRGQNVYELRNDRLAWLFGFSAGVLGGVYA